MGNGAGAGQPLEFVDADLKQLVLDARDAGRDSVTINSGGEKIFAEEVEQALAKRTVTIDVHHSRFSASEVRVRPGETVRFVLRNRVQGTVTILGDRPTTGGIASIRPPFWAASAVSRQSGCPVAFNTVVDILAGSVIKRLGYGRQDGIVMLAEGFCTGAIALSAELQPAQ